MQYYHRLYKYIICGITVTATELKYTTFSSVVTYLLEVISGRFIHLDHIQYIYLIYCL